MSHTVKIQSRSATGLRVISTGLNDCLLPQAHQTKPVSRTSDRQSILNIVPHPQRLRSGAGMSLERGVAISRLASQDREEPPTQEMRLHRPRAEATWRVSLWWAILGSGTFSLKCYPSRLQSHPRLKISLTCSRPSISCLFIQK